MTDVLNVALDRFDVPPFSAGFADRIVAAASVASPSLPAVPRRDRRGMWRRGRQIVLGSLGVGLLSAGAVASGLLGRVGIEVPVFSAMLAPVPKASVKPAPVRTALAKRPATVAAPALTVEPPPNLTAPLPAPERWVLRQEMRERRQAFAVTHPVAAAVIRERVAEELRRRAQARREKLIALRGEASTQGEPVLAPADEAALMRAARRDRFVAERMIDRRIQAREARLAERGGSATETGRISNQGQWLSFDERVARRARLAQMSPDERSRMRDAWQRQRAARIEQQQSEAGPVGPGEGIPASPR
jgi:hypothetical protein